MPDVEDKLVKAREGLEKAVEECAAHNPDYAERLRAQLDSVQPALDDLQDMISDSEMGGTPRDEGDDEGDRDDETEEGEGDE